MQDAIELIMEKQHQQLMLNQEPDGSLKRKKTEATLNTENDFVVSEDLAVVAHYRPSWFHLKIPNLQPMPRHCHSCFELIYVHSGTFCNAVEEKDFLLDTSKVVLIPPGYYHAPYIRSDSDQVLNILIQPQLMERTLYFFGSNNMELESFFYEYIYGLPVSMEYLLLEKTEAIRKIVENMVCIYSSFDTSQAPRLMSCFVQLIVAMAESYRVKKPENMLQKTAVQEMILYIRTHYLTITRSELCQRFHYSPAHVSDLIRRETGKTFKELVQAYKLESAKNLLCTTDFSVEKISEILNFRDPYYLSRIFKQKQGISPSLYRMKYHKK